jgi:putative polyketide hydroxylase
VSDDAYDCDVLIVGGGLIGLGASMFAAQQGLRTWLVERHETISIHPKARGVNVRSMELYRAAGIEAAVRAAGLDRMELAIGDNLAGEYQQPVEPAIDPTGHRLSPTAFCACDQHQIEPVLRARAIELGAELFFNSTVSAIAQDASGVSAEVVADSAQPVTPRHVRARYLVAADGARSRIRDDLGIGRHGRPVAGTGLSVLFDADLAPATRGRNVQTLVSASAGAIFMKGRDSRTRHWMAIPPRAEFDGLDDASLATKVVPMIRTVVGLPDLQPDVESVMTWQTGAFVADRYRAGRIFLVGDAAHLMPPYGGLGGNTGVADAHNLAWKLAAVCDGRAGEELLDTYESERQPIAEYTAGQVARFADNPFELFGRRDMVELQTVAMGFRYCDEAATGFDPAHPVEDPAEPSGQPGTRAPHIELVGAVSSTLDLLDPAGFTFVAADTSPYIAALAGEPVPGVRTRAIRREDVADLARWDAIYDSAAAPGMLIRPDGVISWRADPGRPDPRVAVEHAYHRALHRR